MNISEFKTLISIKCMSKDVEQLHRVSGRGGKRGRGFVCGRPTDSRPGSSLSSCEGSSELLVHGGKKRKSKGFAGPGVGGAWFLVTAWHMGCNTAFWMSIIFVPPVFILWFLAVKKWKTVMLSRKMYSYSWPERNSSYRGKAKYLGGREAVM